MPEESLGLLLEEDGRPILLRDSVKEDTVNIQINDHIYQKMIYDIINNDMIKAVVIS